MGKSRWALFGGKREGHLESKLHAARALDSPLEYKQALLLYAKLNADEGFRGKTEELVRD